MAGMIRAKHKELQAWLRLLCVPARPPGSVRNAKCWVGSGAVASSTDFINAFLLLPRMPTACQWFLHKEW